MIGIEVVMYLCLVPLFLLRCHDIVLYRPVSFINGIYRQQKRRYILSEWSTLHRLGRWDRVR